jgi:CRISPR-associated protein Cmr3
MPNTIQFITLAPLSDFFFGNERTFGMDNSHYYAKSDKFPQQTSLLGMLRYELLKSSPTLFDIAQDKVTHAKQAADLIGTNGFGDQYDFAYGIIEGISPVFLLNPDGVPFFVSGSIVLKDSEATKIRAATDFRAYNLLRPESKVEQPFLIERTKGGKASPYDGKVDFEQQLAGSDGSIIDMDKVFHTVQRTNNRKRYDGQTDDAGFFKQDLYRLATGWKFGFLAAFNQPDHTRLGNSRLVHLGAERRHFRMEIQDAQPVERFKAITVEEGVFQNFGNLYGGKKMEGTDPIWQTILLSDAYAPPAVYDTALLAYTSKASFRHLNTHLKDPNDVFKKDKPLPKSSRYTLMARGGSLFSNESTAIETHLAEANAFQRIGYNYFKTL